MSQNHLDWYELPHKRWKNNPEKAWENDSQKQKLYDAENTARYYILRMMDEQNLTSQFNSIEEIQKFTDKLLSSAWIKKRFGKQSIKVVLEERCHYSFARYKSIHLRRTSWNILVVLHEISHVLHPGRVRAGPSHGRFYARTFLELVGHVINPEAMKILKKWFKKGKVKYLPKRELSEETREKLRQGFIDRVLKQKVEV